MIQTIIGKRGKGKTTKSREIILQSQASRILILDYLGEYSSEGDPRVQIFRTGLYEFCQYAWDSSDPGSETLVVFDEVDLYGRNDPHISFLYRYGRHKNINLLAVSRRFYDLPTIVRALTDEFIFFQITEERDLQYLKRLVPENFIQTLISLPDYKYIKLEL